MLNVAKKNQPAFHAAQKRVTDTLAPYQPRCLNQYFSQTGAIETFLVCSRDADAGEGRHKWRGIVTVQYNYPATRGDTCDTFLSFSEDMVSNAIDHKMTGTWEGTGELLAKLIPALSA